MITLLSAVQPRGTPLARRAQRQRRTCSSPIHGKTDYARSGSRFISPRILHAGLPGGFMPCARRPRRSVRRDRRRHWTKQYSAARHGQRHSQWHHGAGANRFIVSARRSRRRRAGTEFVGTAPCRAHRRSGVHRSHVDLYAPSVHDKRI